jgi:hypothetical protein
VGDALDHGSHNLGFGRAPVVRALILRIGVTTELRWMPYSPSREVQPIMGTGSQP